MDKNSKLLLEILLIAIILSALCTYVRTMVFKNFEIINIPESDSK